MSNDAPQLVATHAVEGSPGASDERFYYRENDQRSALLETVIGGSEPPRRLDHLPLLKPNTWRLRGDEIVYADTQATGGNTAVYRAALSGGEPELVATLDLSPDAMRYLLISQDLSEVIWSREENQHDIWIAENFR